MPLRDDSFIPEFLTEERLARYRALTRRFPLWCGLWPEDYADGWEATVWDSESRVNRILRESEVELDDRQEVLGGWHEPPGTDFCPPLVIAVASWEDHLVEDEEGRPFQPTVRWQTTLEPSVGAAWLSALNYTGWRWDGEGPRRGRPTWRQRADSLVEAVRLELSGQRGERRAIDLLHAKERVLASRGRERRQAQRRLSDLWLALGKRIGVLPDVAGGVRSTLPDDFLAQLLQEAAALHVALRAYDPPGSDVAAIRRLEGLGRDQEAEALQLAAEERRARGHPDPDRLLREFMRRLDEEHDVESWSRVLAFPMLSPEEVTTLLDRRSGRSASAELTHGRLPHLAAKTLLNRTRA